MRVATFQVPAHQIIPVRESLVELGFTFGTSRVESITLLDTVDGQLQRAGMRLEMKRSERLELVLSGESTVPARAEIDAVPMLVTDLPTGPFAHRVASLIGARTLVPQLQLNAQRTSATWRNSSGKIVASAELFDDVQVLDRPDLGDRPATIEIHHVPGYVKHASRTIDALRKLSVLACVSDTVAQCATATGVDLAGKRSPASVPLDQEMRAIDGFRTVLANLAVTITSNWQGTLDQSVPDSLKDMRVAVRRTRTILAEAGKVVPATVLEPTRAGFAWLADLTGARRDLDVYVSEWARVTESLGPRAVESLAPVRDLLDRRRAVAHVELEQVLRSDEAIDLIEAWRAWLAQPIDADDLPSSADRPLGVVIAKRIVRAQHVLIEHGRSIGPHSPAEQVHDLRKDAKRLRYLLQCFGSMLPDKPRKKFLRRLQALQDNLGEHQDAEVQLNALLAIAVEIRQAGGSPVTLVAIEQLAERLDHERRAARVAFDERFSHYDTPTTQRALDAVLDGLGLAT